MRLLLRRSVEAVHELTRGLGFLGQLALASMVVTICYDVMMRYVFSRPTHWSLEVNTFLVIFVTLIPAGEVLREDSHLRIHFFVSKLGPRTRNIVGRVRDALGVLFCSLMAWKGLGLVVQAYKYDQRMSTPLGTPMFVPYLFIPVGFAVLGLQFLARLTGRFKEQSPE
jgi:TRAP-type C4-dicarboxylate transport system permease small subunit